MTICFKCKYHDCLWPGESVGPKADTWYYQVCSAPDARLPLVIDPVTGKEGYGHTNDIDQVNLTDDSRPYCRSVNTSGNCPYYEGKL